MVHLEKVKTKTHNHAHKHTHTLTNGHKDTGTPTLTHTHTHIYTHVHTHSVTHTIVAWALHRHLQANSKALTYVLCLYTEAEETTAAGTITLLSYAQGYRIV